MREKLPKSLKMVSEISANSIGGLCEMLVGRAELRRTRHHGKSGRKSFVFSRFSEGLAKDKFNESGRHYFSAYQIPPLTLDSFELFLANDSEDTLWSGSVGMKFEVQRDNIRRFIGEVVETVKELEDDLERVVARPEGEYGM